MSTMKKITSFDHAIGGDGAMASGAVGVRETFLRAEVAIEMPIEKIIQPATKAVDSLLDKVKKLIPGEWDDKAIDEFKLEYKEDLAKYLADLAPEEKPALPETPA